jgi:hypothetical protein
VIELSDAPNNSLKYGYSIAGNTSGNRYIVQYNVPYKSGTTYTASWYVRGKCKAQFRVWNTPDNKSMYLYAEEIDTSTWVKQYTTFVANDEFESDSCTFHIGLSGSGEIEICGMKLEEGTKASSWTPSPLDVDADITYNQSQVTELNDELTELKATANGLSVTVQKCVSTSVYEEAINAVNDRIDDNTDSIKSQLSDISDSVDSANDSLQTMSTTISKYFTFNTNGLTIGSGTSALQLVLDNDQISFVNNGETIAYWDGDNLHTGNIYVDVSEAARFGNFQWVPRSDGSLMLLKVGD